MKNSRKNRTKKQILILLFSLAFLPLRIYSGEHSHWSYHGEGGPEHWGKVDPKYSLCSDGKHQSPIDLRWSKPTTSGKILFHYKDSKVSVIDNGHTIQIGFEEGNKVSIRGKSYDLVQLHFHSASEHTLSGNSFPLEMHLVHKDKDGKLAVLGVFIKEGEKNQLIDQIWSKIPKEKHAESHASDFSLDPSHFLPTAHTYYTYDGSLTTPPCSEGVNWNVFNTPVEFSKEQIETFKKFYTKNNRPLQRLNGRRLANY
jgi:carbonic anhydrase